MLSQAKQILALQVALGKTKNIPHLGVGDIKPAPLVSPPPTIPPYGGLGAQGVRGVGGLPKDRTSKIQFEKLSKTIWLFDGHNFVSVKTQLNTFALL